MNLFQAKEKITDCLSQRQQPSLSALAANYNQ